MIDIARFKLPALVEDCIAHHIRYAFGAKVAPITLDASQFFQVDCSGFTRWAVYHATKVAPNGIGFGLPDGSVNQHDWASANLTEVPIDAGTTDQSHVLIAFLAPNAGRPGHVMLIQEGFTIESHGSAGPSRRKWLSEPFMSECTVYVLATLTD